MYELITEAKNCYLLLKLFKPVSYSCSLVVFWSLVSSVPSKLIFSLTWLQDVEFFSCLSWLQNTCSSTVSPRFPLLKPDVFVSLVRGHRPLPPPQPTPSFGHWIGVCPQLKSKICGQNLTNLGLSCLYVSCWSMTWLYLMYAPMSSQRPHREHFSTMCDNPHGMFFCMLNFDIKIEKYLPTVVNCQWPCCNVHT